MNLGALHELPDEDLLRALNAMRQPTRQQVEKERKESGDMALMDLLAFTTQPRDTESDTRNDSPRCRPSNSYLRTLTQITRSPALGDGRVHDEEPLEARRDTTPVQTHPKQGKDTEASRTSPVSPWLFPRSPDDGRDSECVIKGDDVEVTNAATILPVPSSAPSALTPQLPPSSHFDSMPKWAVVAVLKRRLHELFRCTFEETNEPRSPISLSSKSTPSVMGWWSAFVRSPRQTCAQPHSQEHSARPWISPTPQTRDKGANSPPIVARVLPSKGSAAARSSSPRNVLRQSSMSACNQVVELPTIPWTFRSVVLGFLAAMLVAFAAVPPHGRGISGGAMSLSGSLAWKGVEAIRAVVVGAVTELNDTSEAMGDSNNEGEWRNLDLAVELDVTSSARSSSEGNAGDAGHATPSDRMLEVDLPNSISADNPTNQGHRGKGEKEKRARRRRGEASVGSQVVEGDEEHNFKDKTSTDSRAAGAFRLEVALFRWLGDAVSDLKQHVLDVSNDEDGISLRPLSSPGNEKSAPLSRAETSHDINDDIDDGGLLTYEHDGPSANRYTLDAVGDRPNQNETNPHFNASMTTGGALAPDAESAPTPATSRRHVRSSSKPHTRATKHGKKAGASVIRRIGRLLETQQEALTMTNTTASEPESSDDQAGDGNNGPSYKKKASKSSEDQADISDDGGLVTSDLSREQKHIATAETELFSLDLYSIKSTKLEDSALTSMKDAAARVAIQHAAAEKEAAALTAAVAALQAAEEKEATRAAHDKALKAAAAEEAAAARVAAERLASAAAAEAAIRAKQELELVSATGLLGTMENSKMNPYRHWRRVYYGVVEDVNPCVNEVNMEAIDGITGTILPKPGHTWLNQSFNEKEPTLKCMNVSTNSSERQQLMLETLQKRDLQWKGKIFQASNVSLSTLEKLTTSISPSDNVAKDANSAIVWETAIISSNAGVSRQPSVRKRRSISSVVARVMEVGEQRLNFEKSVKKYRPSGPFKMRFMTTEQWHKSIQVTDELGGKDLLRTTKSIRDDDYAHMPLAEIFMGHLVTSSIKFAQNLLRRRRSKVLLSEKPGLGGSRSIDADSTAVAI